MADLRTSEVSLEFLKKFAFGGESLEEAIEQVGNAPMPMELKEFLLEHLQYPNLDILGARHAPVTDKLNAQFDAAHIEGTIGVLRGKFLKNLENYEFSRFVAPKGGDQNNPYFPDHQANTPEEFRQDATEFPEAEKKQFKAGMQENCAETFNGKPGLGWPMIFYVFLTVSEDEKGVHLYIHKDEAQQLWYGKALCFVPPRAKP